VESLTSDDDDSFCAILSSGGVDCWGLGYRGELGDGNYHPSGSATPVQVVGVGGQSTLSDVASIAGSGDGDYCAFLTSGGVDCWGFGYSGELGNGILYSSPDTGSGTGSPTPVQVIGVGGVGTLSGVASIEASGNGFCALLTSGGVDCWGDGDYGQLGDGTFYTTGNEGSATPVQVIGVGGVGTLSGVASLDSNDTNAPCAVLTSGGVDCWGYGLWGQLGDGTFYSSGNEGSDTPVQVSEVLVAPSVTIQPMSHSYTTGQSLTFTAAASGSPTPTVQWQYSYNGGGTWTNLAGATSPTLTVGPLTNFVNGWEVRAVFTNSVNSAASNPATMTFT
jgi:alpha-tubulin suppressor-like RCC1 family protein